MNLLVHLLHYPVRTLGPGVRAGLWCQGCTIGCPGCITPESRAFLPECAVSVDDLAERITGYDAPLTISGGEPFDQAEALFVLLRLLNAKGLFDILIYSGYTAEDLLRRHPRLPELSAALVDGPFEAGNATDETWKGSANQRLHIWKPEFEEPYRNWTRSTTRRLQLVRDKRDKNFLIGIPKQEDAEKLKQLSDRNMP